MNTKELRKLLKDNGVCAYTYWGKEKLIDLAKITTYYQNQRSQSQKKRKNQKNQKR